MKNSTLLVDFSNFCYIAFFSAQSHPNPSKYEVGELLGSYLTNKLKGIEKNLAQCGFYVEDIIFVEDSYPCGRNLIYPEYKAHRQGFSPVPKREIKEFLKTTRDRWSFCHSPSFEADDVIAALCKELRRKHTSLFVLSMDRDLWMLLDPPKINIYEPRDHRFITKKDVYSAFRVKNPKHITLYKTLWGDGCDGVPNVLPRTQKKFLPLIRKSDGSLEDFTALVKSNWSELSLKYRKAFKKAQAEMQINYQLVSLHSTCPIIFS